LVVALAVVTTVAVAVVLAIKTITLSHRVVVTQLLLEQMVLVKARVGAWVQVAVILILYLHVLLEVGVVLTVDRRVHLLAMVVVMAALAMLGVGMAVGALAVILGMVVEVDLTVLALAVQV
jgi:hypothetical protein